MRTLLFPLLFILSCADGQAEEKCDAFRLAWCDSLVEQCGLESQGLSEEDCQDLMQTPMNCASVVDIGESYDNCIGDIQAVDECLLDQDPPSSCEGVLLTE